MNDLIHSASLPVFDDFDRLFNDLWRSFSEPSRLINAPAADIYSEDNKHMVIELPAPGFDQSNLDIGVRNGVLEISGQRTDHDEQKSKRSYVMRGTSSSFTQRIALPEGANADSITAELDKGVLKLTIPVERPQAKRIPITSRQSSAKKLTAKSDS